MSLTSIISKTRLTGSRVKLSIVDLRAPAPLTDFIFEMSKSSGIVMEMLLLGGRGFVVLISKFRLV